MASNFMSLAPILTSPPPHHHHHHHHHHIQLQWKPFTAFPLSPQSNGPSTALRRRRGELVAVKAGPPSSTSLIIAFVLPLSLLLGTVFVSIRIADRLDEQYLEELAMNRAVSEENEEEEEEGGDGLGEITMDGEGNIVLGEKEEEVAAAAASAVPRVRNRPRRQS